MSVTASLTAVAARSTELQRGSVQYLTFTCAEEQYGVDILRVQEIRGWSAVTCLPGAPSDMMGVLNLRGSIVPVISLRARFGLESRPVDSSTVVIVLRVESGAGSRTIGICVDEVTDVNTVETTAIMAAPSFGGDAERQSVSGLVTLSDRTVMLLNADRLLGD